MDKLKVLFLSKSKSFLLEIENDYPSSNFFFELVSIFSKIDHQKRKIKTIALQQYSDKIERLFKQIIEKYRESNPRIFQINNFTSSLNKNEHFFVLPLIEPDLRQLICLDQYLSLLNTSGVENKTEFYEKLKDFNEKSEEIFSIIFDNYHIYTHGSNRNFYIGEADKLKRICRFCKRNSNQGASFRNRAHAISEALGNKKVFLNEECDDCNEYFDKNVERDLINFLSLHRVIFKAKGKVGVPKIKFQNGSSIDDNDGAIRIKVKGESEDSFSPNGFRVKDLKLHEKIKPQNIYKALCKYALSIIDSKYIVYFDKTISWINNKSETDINLPKVAMLIKNSLYLEHPHLFLYVRKTKNNNLPFAVAELRFFSLIFIYIVPFAIEDTIDFSDTFEFDRFWKTFKHYSGVNGWLFNDFSSNKIKELSYNINLYRGA